MDDILHRIVATKREEIAAAKSRVTEAELRAILRDLPQGTPKFSGTSPHRPSKPPVSTTSPTKGEVEEKSVGSTTSPLVGEVGLQSEPGGGCENPLAHSSTKSRSFAAAIRGIGFPNVIAEVKKASPSAGVLRADFDPVAIARTYEAHGASALSVLTDESYFQGHLSYLTAIREAVAIPLLRKEFILDEYQLLEARAAGADAVLLIAECLPGDELKHLHAAAVAIGLEVLVELHDAIELDRVLACGAAIVGVNNRDLRTFATRLEHCLELRPLVPDRITFVAESGIKSHSDMVRLAAAGVHAVLVGESLIRSPDIGSALDSLRNGSND